MDLALKDLGEYIASQLPEDIIGTDIHTGELTVSAKTEGITRVLSFLRDDVNCRFKQLMDICGVDHPDRVPRFEVVYNLLSLINNNRIRVKVKTDEETPVPTATEIFSSANWWERETWDLFGIYFSNHPDLRRILSDYGFEGHPLRKDFPLTGFVEVRYDGEKKRVVYEPVKLTQDFRSFDFLSPWEGAQALLPGDEKAEEDAEEEGDSDDAETGKAAEKEGDS